LLDSDEGLFLFARCGLFGSFERIDFGFHVLDFDLLMGGEIAETLFPLLCRGRGHRADGPDAPIDDTLTTLAGFHYQLAAVAFKDTALFRPKGALGTGKNGLTLHGCCLLAYSLRLNDTYKTFFRVCQ
jgi:hypothetical protein